MKKLIEPLIASFMGVVTWEAFQAFVITLIVAFLSGALGFLGKYLVQRVISIYNNRKNGRL